MPTKLILPGRAVEPPARFEPDLSDFLNVEIKRVQIVDTARGATREEQAFANAEETDIVEREWSNGIKQWVSVAQLRQDLAPDGAARGVSTEDLSELHVPDAPPIAGVQRGSFDWALKGLKILRIDPAEKTAQWTARQIVGHFENQLKPEAGLYRLSGAWSMEENKLTAGDLDATAPYLVFIHGTALDTDGSFGQLAGTPEGDALQKRYQARMLGFQHRTMSQSPIQNALELAQTLPAGAKLHLVTHSRGGLVGELLCLGPLEKADLAPFVAAHRRDDVAHLEQLSRELSAKNFQIEKFVRVACPARGTILVSQRLDLYFSIILNVLGLIPALQASPVYSFVKATLLELAKRRTRPEELPGLEAQMPESPVIDLLNRPGATTKADLAVIAGDIKGNGIWSSLKALATDLYYREDHDLVVNTKAMYGGLNREGGAYYFFDQGPDVNHFSYFANSRTRQRMHSWLTRADGQPRDENFGLIAHTLDRGLAGEQMRAAAAIPSQAGQIHTLLISVAHGDLARAKYPIAVGHYRGDAIVSAESRLDKLLNQRLSELFGMYLYPGPIGSAEVILEREGQPKGALIIGLGEVGEITPEVIRRGITNAALRYALTVANEVRPGAELNPAQQQNGADAQTWRSAAFSALLLGTYGGNALSVDSSVAAIIQGAIQANHALRARKLWERVQIDEVQIVELYEDIAIEAVRAAHNLEQRPPVEITGQEKLVVEPPYLESLGGGRFQRPANQYARGWWRRIQITGERDRETGERTGNLHFLSLTDRARAEDTLQSTQRELINSFIEKAVHSPTYDEKLASTLFELLLPNVLKEQTQVEASLVLVLDKDAAQYPWELLKQRGGSQPLAVRMGLLRQFVTSHYHPTPQPAREPRALVIGATQAIETREGKFPALPGARAEALAVSKVIGEAGYDVSSTLIDADGLTIISELLTKEHRILHLAGHGVYHAPGARLHPDEQNDNSQDQSIPHLDEPLRSGMVLGDGVFLATTELRSLGAIPELAFINCCHLAQIDNEPKLTNPSPHRLAASIAQELINKGVKAVVAAGWAVEDEAAAAFAKAFYEMMLGGQTFGEAVRYARQTTWKKFPGNNTWGAYQCYGNPGFVLEQTESKRSSVADKTRALYSRQEYLEELLSITEVATRAGSERRAEMEQQLKRLDQELPSHWRDGGVLSEFGAAWAALGNFAPAIDYYRQAIKGEKAEAPLSAVEQLANLLSRHVESLRTQQETRAAKKDGTKPAEFERRLTELIEEALSLLDWAAQLEKTTERLSLYGGHYKRLALAAKGAQRGKLLKQARDYYGQAHREKAAQSELDFYYPALNWIACRYLLGEKKLKEDRPLLKLLKDCRQAAARKAQREPDDFWSRVAEPDAELLAHLINDDLPAHTAKILKRYQKVIAPGAKPKDIASVKGQYDAYIRILASRPGTNHAATLAALKEIQAAIGK
ncbi:hypothetical protein BH18ACI2_BH18ACI2_10110 [soil metagenome]